MVSLLGNGGWWYSGILELIKLKQLATISLADHWQKRKLPLIESSLK